MGGGPLIARLFDVLALVALLVALLAVWFALTLPRPLRPSAVEYDLQEYMPVVSLLCPGDPLRYTNRRTVYRPALMVGQRTWYSVSEQRTVVREELITTAVEPGTWVTNWVVPLPPSLEPGAYRMVQVFTEAGSETVAYAVPFVLRRC